AAGEAARPGSVRAPCLACLLDGLAPALPVRPEARALRSNRARSGEGLLIEPVALVGDRADLLQDPNHRGVVFEHPGEPPVKALSGALLPDRAQEPQVDALATKRFLDAEERDTNGVDAPAPGARGQ